MNVTTRNRADLKSYFVKNAIPTQSNFAELIDGMLNQKDDGLVKLPNNPLCLEAAGAGDNASEKKALALYDSLAQDRPAWTLSLNPRSNPNDAGSGRLGLNISDGDGNNRLFIDRNTGNVGIGTISPAAKLDVQGTVYFGTGQNNQNHKVVLRGPNQPGNSGSYQDLSFEFAFAGSARVRAYRGGSWDTYLQFLTNPASANADSPQVRLHINQDGNVGIGTTGPSERLHISGGKLQLEGNQQIKFSDTDVSNNLKLQLWTGFGLGINGSTLFYAANGNHSWRDNNGVNERMLLTTAADGGLTVKGTGASTFAGNLNVGGVLTVSGAITPSAGDAPTSGIMFPPDPFGGAGDRAWIRYHNTRGGEKGTLEIGIANDGDDHIALMPSGNVGIGTTNPAAKLYVNGSIGSPLWRVTQVFERRAGPLPVSGPFSSGGGTLLVFVSGTAFRGAIGVFSFEILIDNNTNFRGFVDVAANEVNSHKAFPTTALVFGGVAAGAHTLTINAWANGTLTDFNDRFHATVVEFPF